MVKALIKKPIDFKIVIALILGIICSIGLLWFSLEMVKEQYVEFYDYWLIFGGNIIPAIFVLLVYFHSFFKISMDESMVFIKRRWSSKDIYRFNKGEIDRVIIKHTFLSKKYHDMPGGDLLKILLSTKKFRKEKVYIPFHIQLMNGEVLKFVINQDNVIQFVSAAVAAGYTVEEIK